MPLLHPEYAKNLVATSEYYHCQWVLLRLTLSAPHISPSQYWPIPDCSFMNISIGYSDNGSTSTCYWPPGSLHALGAGGHIQRRDWLFCGLKFFALNIFWASKDTCLLIQYVSEQDCTQSLVVISKTWVVLLISTIVSGYNHVMA